MPSILCLWFPNWAIQRIVHCRPALKGRAVALVADGPRGGQVAVCSREAVAHGVRPRMPLAEAQALAPELTIARHEPLADRAALAKLAEACERFSPRVALEDGGEPESLLLDISNLQHLWDSEAALARQVTKFITRRGYHVRVAVAETVGLAWAFAHAKGGRRKEEGGGQNFVPPSPFPSSSLQSPVPALPIEALRITDDTAALLRQLGIETVDQLAALARDSLASRFGDDLLRRLDQLTGAAREVIEPHRALAALEIDHLLEEPTGDRAVLKQVLRELVEQLVRRLAARDQGAVLMMCFLRCTDGRTTSLRIGLLQPSANSRQLLELVDLHLENVSLTAEVDYVELRVTVTGRLGERQGELFADRWPNHPHQLALLVNRLTSRLGHEQVLRAEPRASAVPERAVRWVAAVEWRKDKETRRGGGKERRPKSRSPGLLASLSPCPSPRPLTLFPKVESLSVVSVAPGGPPQFVWVANRRERVVHFAGPERIESLWWRGSSVRRDYYRVAVESGSHLWIFRRRSDGRWFVHGSFA